MTEHQIPKSRKKTRLALMLGGPLLVAAIAAFIYVQGLGHIATDNAYVKAAQILLTPEISGRVIAVDAGDNQKVARGDVLVAIDPEPYEVALARAEADLANAAAGVAGMKAHYAQLVQDVAAAKAQADYADKEYARMAELKTKDAVSQSRVDDALRARDGARSDMAARQQEMNETLAQLQGDADIAVTDHAMYKAALATRDKARLDLRNTTMRAPVDGVTGKMPNVGDYAHAGVPLMPLVAAQNAWVEANYKETELTDVRVGQKATITVDTYPGVTWQGRVESISPSTGSEFSVLPAENATGNWVKIVQRITVRVAIDHQQGEPDLRGGMSAHVSIATRPEGA